MGYKGIDYGMGLANVDTSNGIRTGVIPVGSLADWALDEFQPVYPDPTCPHCGNAVTDVDIDDETQFGPAGRFEHYGKECTFPEYACEHCEKLLAQDDCIADEPSGHEHDSDGTRAILDSYNDVFITLSPYFTRAQFCSPCAPGACHLSHPMDNGERAYCFGHEWYESKKAPYPVYAVATGEPVPPPTDA